MFVRNNSVKIGCLVVFGSKNNRESKIEDRENITDGDVRSMKLIAIKSHLHSLSCIRISHSYQSDSMFNKNLYQLHHKSRSCLTSPPWTWHWPLYLPSMSLSLTALRIVRPPVGWFGSHLSTTRRCITRLFGSHLWRSMKSSSSS